MTKFCLEVSGDFACFTRPEMKVERVSYDVITPSAARAVFESILWKPQIRWQVTRIEVFLSDENASKPGDKRCRMEARPAGLPPVTVTATADKVADAFISAAEKLQRALEADIGRGKNHKGGETIRTGE